MKSNKNRVIMSLLVLGMLFSLVTANTLSANENDRTEENVEDDTTLDYILDEEVSDTVVEESKEESNNIETVDATTMNDTITPYAITDSVFSTSSRPLEQAIITKYDGNNGTIKIDTDGDGYISASEAAAMSGELNLVAQGITGTLNGLENFIGLEAILLHENQFEGSIPKELGNLVNLSRLYLRDNQLSGEIPKELGNMQSLTQLQLGRNKLTGSIPKELANLNNLAYLYLFDNQLSGEIPKELGQLNLTKIRAIIICNNNLSGSIPEELGNLASLAHLDVSGNNLSESIPQSIYSLGQLVEARFNGNTELTGNPYTGFASHTKLAILDVSGTKLIQVRPEISTLLESNGGLFIYDNLAENLLTLDKTGIIDGLTQDDIDRAQESANYITDASQKQQWEENIALAQKLFDAKEEVDELFSDTIHTNVIAGLVQNDIDDARTTVSDLPNGTFKDDLNAEIDKAQNMLNAINATNDMFDNEGILKENISQSDIDDTQTLVDLVVDGNLKIELQNKIDDAQRQLNEKDAKAKVEDLFTDKDHTDIKDSTNQKAIDEAQDMLDAKDAVEDLFNDKKDNLADGTTQKDIDNAQDLVNKLPDCELKDELQKEIDKAQDMLDAKEAVDNLFNDKKDNLADNVTQKDIDNTQDLVNKLPDGELKDELQKEIDKAQAMQDAKDAANDLLDKDGNLNSNVTQEDIDNAQDLVNKLPAGELKDELQLIIDEAQKQLDEKNISKPSTAPGTTVKPSVDSTSTTGGSNVNTGDETNMTLYMGLFAISLAGIVLVVRKRKIEE